MRYFPLLLVSVFVLFASCKKSKEEQIIRKWRSVAVESPGLDEQLALYRAFLDTVGQSTTPEQNLELYQTTNIDSFKNVEKMKIEAVLAEQDTTIKNTFLDFHKDGTVTAAFGDAPETLYWYFDEEGNLALDETKTRGENNRIKMHLVKLEDTVLQLSYSQGDQTSTATFRPE
jgi:hypothetical protein